MSESTEQPQSSETQQDGKAAQLTIGCHESSSKGYLAMAKTAVKIGANDFQFFTRNPRGCKAKDIDPTDIERFHAYAKENGIRCILAHAPYTLNFASKKEELREFAADTMADDMRRMEYTPGQMYNLHPGSHTGQGVERGIEEITEILNRVISPEQSTMVLLETMAGKGTEIGRTFEELKAIIDGVHVSDRIGVCLDTCHVWDGGYDIKDDLDGVLDEFDEVIGLNRLHAIHLNDSKNPCGAHKDRHEKIGDGYIGFEALSAVTRNPRLRDLPFFLETPNELSGYASEIKRLRDAWTA